MPSPSPRSAALLLPALVLAASAAVACGPAYGPVQIPPTMQLRAGGCAKIDGKSHLVGGGPMVSRQPMDAFAYDVTSSQPAIASAQTGTEARRAQTYVFAKTPGTSELTVSFTAPETGARDTRRVTVTVAGDEDEKGRERCAQLAKELPVEPTPAK